MPLGIPLGRIFGGQPPPQTSYQVIAHGEMGGPVSADELEEMADKLLEVLEDHASDLALGPVVGYDVEKHLVEVEFTVEARNAEELHKKLGQFARLLEREDLLDYSDTTASRIDPQPDPEREVVLA